MKQERTAFDKFWIGIIVGFIVAFLILPPKVEIQEKIILQNEGNSQFDKYMPLDYILNKVANQEYILDKHDCTQFSEDLVRELDKFNIKAETITVDDNDPSTKLKHMIVGIWFEPQDGELISTWDNYERIK